MWEWLESLEGGAASFVGSVAGSGFGLIALLIGALFNSHLNRKRDERLRTEEARTVAAALYGEILLLRRDLARVSNIVGKTYMAGEYNPSLKFDKHFLERTILPEPHLYTALASKVGLLEPRLVIWITEFHQNFHTARIWIPRLVEDGDRKFSYSVLHVLDPAEQAIEGVKPALRLIEGMLGIHDPASDPEMGAAHTAIADQREVFEGRW